MKESHPVRLENYKQPDFKPSFKLKTIYMDRYEFLVKQFPLQPQLELQTI